MNKYKDLPKDWNIHHLKDLFEIKKGKKVKITDNNKDAIPYIGIENLRGIPISQFTSDKNGLLCDKKDILLVWDGANCGTVGTGLSGYVGSTIALLRPISAQLDKDYIFHLLKSKFLYFNSTTTGATIPHLDRKRIESFIVPFPPLQVQKKIVAILEKAERLKEWREEAVVLTDEFLKSMFWEMFGDPVNNPKGWKIMKLGELGEVSSGLTLDSKRRANRNNLYPYLRVANVFRNKIDLKEIKYIHASNSEFKKFLLENNDVLIVEGHGNSDEIGRAAIWNGEISNCLHQNHIIKVRLNNKYLNPYFLSYYLNNYGNHGYFSTESRTTSGLNTISISKVRNAEIHLPPIHLQDNFAIFCVKIEKIKELQNQSKENIENLFNVSLQKAFNGDLI